jgi:hypothetical protein
MPSISKTSTCTKSLFTTLQISKPYSQKLFVKEVPTSTDISQKMSAKTKGREYQAKKVNKTDVYIRVAQIVGTWARRAEKVEEERENGRKWRERGR